MDVVGSGSPPGPCLPRELLLRILALLPPNDLVLSGRLTFKEAAQHFQGPQHCTLFLGQPLPSHVSAVSAPDASSSPSLRTPTTIVTATAFVSDTRWSWLQTGAEEAVRRLTFRRKLLLLSRAAASGCEANVELAWHLLQQHVFPEVLQSNHSRILLQRGQSPGGPAPDVGSIAVASGLAHLLPSLAQRCPGLLDPGATLEAAAKHCDLAGLQAAWEAVGQRLQQGCERDGHAAQPSERLQGIWNGVLTAAAGSGTLDALAKLEWVMGMSSGCTSDPGALAQAYGAAAASGDLARVRWLRERGVGWGTPGVLEAVVKHADLGSIQQLEEAEGGYLPPAHDESWSRESVVSAAATSRKGSAAKLRWLAGRGAVLGLGDAVARAAERGDLEAVQLLVEHWRARHGAAAAPPPDDTLGLAIASGSVPTAAFLRQAGCSFGPSAFASASARGHLAMVRWLAEAGCPVEWKKVISHTVYAWPRDLAADGERLLEALRVLAELGAPVGDAAQLWSMAVFAGHPWAVLQGLGPPCADSIFAAAAGCEATLRAVVATDGFKDHKRLLQFSWYCYAAANGDVSTLACLRRLGLRPGRGVIGVAVHEGAPLSALQWLIKHGAPWYRSDLTDRLSQLAAAYPSPRDDERRDVEAWLRGRLACTFDSELCELLLTVGAAFMALFALALIVVCSVLYSWGSLVLLPVTGVCLAGSLVVVICDPIA